MPGGARAVLLCAVLLLGATCSEETSAERGPRPSLSPAEVEAAVTTGGIEEHLTALQEIADKSDGNRAAGTDGHWESVRYFRGRLKEAGYDVRLDYFTFPFFDVVKPGVLKIKGGPRFEDGTDHLAMIYSASGNVTGPLTPVAFDPEGVGHNGPGCSPEAFGDVEAGDVVLLRPGPCFFRDQVLNAQDAGAREELLRVLTRAYDYVVIDAGNVINACVAAALYAADTIFLVTNPDVPSIRNAQRLVDRVRQLGAGSERVKVLLNRASDQNLVGPKQIETALGYGIHHTFSSDYRTVSTALNSGVPLSLTNHSEIAAQFDSFTRHLVGLADDVRPEPERKRVFLGLF